MIAGQCEPTVRRAIEVRLVRRFHARLVERGVRGYPFEQCWDDYRMALLLPGELLEARFPASVSR